jgi:excisionase family DNA binding protein
MTAPVSNAEPLIDAAVAGEILHLHPKTVKRLAGAGEIPGFRIGRLWRFRASVLDEWVRSQLTCQPPAVSMKGKAGE